MMESSNDSLSVRSNQTGFEQLQNKTGIGGRNKFFVDHKNAMSRRKRTHYIFMIIPFIAYYNSTI